MSPIVANTLTLWAGAFTLGSGIVLLVAVGVSWLLGMDGILGRPASALDLIQAVATCVAGWHCAIACWRPGRREQGVTAMNLVIIKFCAALTVALGVGQVASAAIGLFLIDAAGQAMATAAFLGTFGIASLITGFRAFFGAGR